MKRNIYKILLFSFTLTILSCGDKKTETSLEPSETSTIKDTRIQLTDAQFTKGKMLLGSFEEKEFPTLVSVTGMIDVPPENRSVVSATMGGYIKSTPFLIGDKVKKGQALVTIENPEFVTIQQQYMEVNEQLNYLKSEYDRQVTMHAENITSQKSYLKAESAYKTALARHRGLEKQLRMLNISPARVQSGVISSVASIFAPISGSITKVNVTKGTYVSPATSILEIIDNDHIHIELSVFEKDVMKLKKGQKIDFKIPEASTETFKAEVYLVGTAIESNRTIHVHGHLEDETSNRFLVGMFVEANIITDSTSAKALPSSSIIDVDNVPYVLVLDEKEAGVYYLNQVKVDVKENYKGYTVIANMTDFNTNTKFLTKGAFNLLGE